jgi:hypothetical protein
MRSEKPARDIAKLTDKDVHHDYGDLLARGDVDAVLIAAPDHCTDRWPSTLWPPARAFTSKKPMTHTLEEARDRG